MWAYSMNFRFELTPISNDKRASVCRTDQLPDGRVNNRSVATKNCLKIGVHSIEYRLSCKRSR